MMKSHIINIVGLLIDNKFVEFRLPLVPWGMEVLLLDCKTNEEDAIVILVDSDNTIVLKLGEIEKCVLLRNFVPKFICIFLKKKLSIGGRYCQMLTFLYRPELMDKMVGKIRRESVSVFTDFAFHNGVKMSDVNTLKDIDSHIDGFKLAGSKGVKDFEDLWSSFQSKIVEMINSDSDPVIESDPAAHQFWCRLKHSRFYLAYVHFIDNNSLCERDFKTYMRSMKNFPNFFKEALGCESPVTLWVVVETFITDHRCQNSKDCLNFTYLKCSECKYSYYCCKECQIKNWPRHKLFCQHIKRTKTELDSSRAVFQTYIQKQLNYDEEKSPPTFEIFTQEIERALFNAYFSVIEHTDYFDEAFKRNICTEGKRSWIKSLKSLQKKRYKEAKISLKTLEAQLIEVFGPEARFSKYRYEFF